MTDALIFAAILLVVVFSTQIGRRRHTVFLAVAPFISSAVIGVLALGTGQHHYEPADAAFAAIGVLLGLLVGLALNGTMVVWRDPDSAKLYTRAGLAYLAIWLVVLVGRIVFIYALENSPSFAAQFGRLLVSTHTSPDGVAAFFLLMALAMVISREVGVLLRSRRLERVAA
ncbi:DUF1453 domain-containing protein [Amycolatopsis sp. NPDC059027]|uniref:DUF1453 domain-containing protein n=1 Tax=unclassified Amycolatopsis TaxID=2618356 RepID=UPI0036708E3A